MEEEERGSRKYSGLSQHASIFFSWRSQNVPLGGEVEWRKKKKRGKFLGR